MGTPVTFSLDEIQPAPPPAQQKKPVTFNLSEIRPAAPQLQPGTTPPKIPYDKSVATPRLQAAIEGGQVPVPPQTQFEKERQSEGWRGYLGGMADFAKGMIPSRASVLPKPWDAEEMKNFLLNAIPGYSIAREQLDIVQRGHELYQQGRSTPYIAARSLAAETGVINPTGTEQAAEKGQQARILGQATLPIAAATLGPPATRLAGKVLGRTAQGVANLGEAQAKADVALDKNARANVQPQVSKAADAFHTDASQAMQRPLEIVDQKFPEGAIDAGKRRAQVQADLGDLINTDPGKMPPSIREILAKPETSTEKPMPQATAYEALAASQLAKRFIANGMNPSDIRATLAAQGYSARAVDAAQASLAGTGELGPDNWTAFQAKELRTKVSNDYNHGNYTGPMQALLEKTRQGLTQDLNGAMSKADVLPDWQRGNAKWAFWAQNIDNPRSLIGRILNGENADEIMNPLIGADKVPTRQMLGQLANYGLNPQDIATAAKLHEWMGRGENWATPHRWQIMFAPMTGGASLLPTIPGRLMQWETLARTVAKPTASELNMFKVASPFSPEGPVATTPFKPQLALPPAEGSTVLPSSGQTIQLGQSAEGMQALAKQTEAKLTRDLSTGRISQADVMDAAKRGDIDAKAPTRIFRAAKRGVPEPPPSTAEEYLNRRQP